ncbi:YbaB/EbfC family nucleoid-associated protein [Williamsia herbipolensis]|uniref:YbaB/EbfC family nucleoid-associated protein n=1 Tax=Williamsia herbipolensis TaxID=1603258 RepID=UPI0005F7FFE9|nr:YbaB/EbfC family nucleoid-associated protein [Williamsia herbipolensis]
MTNPENVDPYAHLGEMIERVGVLQNEALAITASALSHDRLVEVWVNATGVVIKIEIDPEAHAELGARGLAATITDTTQEAAAIAQREVAVMTAQIREVTGISKVTAELAQVPGLADLTTPVTASTTDPDSEERTKSRADRGGW